MATFSGPIPPPDQLAQYAEIHPELVTEIVATVSFGHEIAGEIFGVSGIAGIVAAFIYGSKKPNQ